MTTPTTDPTSEADNAEQDQADAVRMSGDPDKVCEHDDCAESGDDLHLLACSGGAAGLIYGCTPHYAEHIQKGGGDDDRCVDCTIAELLLTIAHLREDAEMAVDERWDKSDEGFADQMFNIDQTLQRTGLTLPDIPETKREALPTSFDDKNCEHCQGVMFNGKCVNDSDFTDEELDAIDLLQCPQPNGCAECARSFGPRYTGKCEH